MLSVKSAPGMMDVMANGPPGAGTTLLVTTTVITTLAVISALRLALYPSKQRAIDNPLKTVVSKLSEKEVAQLEYKPDHFPGARDVATPVCDLGRKDSNPNFARGNSTDITNAVWEHQGLRVGP